MSFLVINAFVSTADQIRPICLPSSDAMQRRSFVGSNPFVGNYYSIFISFHFDRFNVVPFVQLDGVALVRRRKKLTFYSKSKFRSSQMMNAKGNTKKPTISRMVQNIALTKSMSFVPVTQTVAWMHATATLEVLWWCPFSRMAGFLTIKSGSLATAKASHFNKSFKVQSRHPLIISISLQLGCARPNNPGLESHSYKIYEMTFCNFIWTQISGVYTNVASHMDWIMEKLK